MSASTANTAAADCFRCLGQVAPYAGRKIGSRYAHKPGACVTRGESEREAVQLARQGNLFAATCTRIDESASSASTALCEFATTSAAAAAEHFRTEHGAKQLSTDKPIKLRRSPAKPKFAAVDVPIFKQVAWTETSGGLSVNRRGQFWSHGTDPHSIWVIPVPVNGRPQAAVQLWTDKAGRAYRNYSDARSARRYGRAA